MKDLKPNFTQIPNEFLDFDLADLSGGEFKILMYICRKTYGYQKQKDRISLSQFTDGVKNFDGKTINKGVGISRPQVVKILKSLEEKGYIESQKTEKKVTIFRLKNAGDSESELVNKVNQQSNKVVKKVNQTGKESLPELVNKVNPQKKNKIKYTKEKNVATKLQPTSGVFSDEQKDDFKLVEILVNFIKQNNPFYQNREFKYNQKKWINDIRLMRERDGLTRQEISYLINFSQTDDFWKQNILSTSKLRKQVPKLVMQMKAKTKKSGVGIF